MISGCDPLTPEDIAEVIVFAATRRENVVVADSLIFPNHQVCPSSAQDMNVEAMALTIKGFRNYHAPETNIVYAREDSVNQER